MLDLLCEVARKPKMKTQLNGKSNRNILASFSLFIERLNRFIRERFKYKTICLRLSQTRKNGKTWKTKQLILMIICQELIPKGSLFILYRDAVQFWMTFKLAIFFQNECSTISKWNHASINDDDSMRQTHWCLFLRAAFECDLTLMIPEHIFSKDISVPEGRQIIYSISNFLYYFHQVCSLNYVSQLNRIKHWFLCLTCGRTYKLKLTNSPQQPRYWKDSSSHDGKYIVQFRSHIKCGVKRNRF